MTDDDHTIDDATETEPTRADELKAGDRVIVPGSASGSAADGEAHTVETAHSTKRQYRVTFTDGTSIRCSADGPMYDDLLLVGDGAGSDPSADAADADGTDTDATYRGRDVTDEDNHGWVADETGITDGYADGRTMTDGGHDELDDARTTEDYAGVEIDVDWSDAGTDETHYTAFADDGEPEIRVRERSRHAYQADRDADPTRQHYAVMERGVYNPECGEWEWVVTGWGALEGHGTDDSLDQAIL